MSKNSIRYRNSKNRWWCEFEGCAYTSNDLKELDSHYKKHEEKCPVQNKKN